MSGNAVIKKTLVTKGGKDTLVKVRNVARTMTSATHVATLPRGARILFFMLSGTASNAGTTATLSVGSTSANANEFVNGANVLSAGVGNGVSVLTGVTGAVGTMPSSVNTVLTADTRIYVKYAETGTASSAGAWVLYIFYTVGNTYNDDTL